MRKNSKKHCIYAFEFEELGVAYVGQSRELKARFNCHHRSHPRISKLIREGSAYKFIVLEDGVALEEVKKREQHWMDKYESNEYELLNIVKAGAVGFPEDGAYWTLETCTADALEYNTRNYWRKAPKSGYLPAHKNGWLEECCAHMVDGYLAKIKWTLETCKADALKYETKTEWAHASESGYHAARKNDWLVECCAHMTVLQNQWTLETCKADALEYKTKKEWNDAHPGAVKAARINDWLDECCAHMRNGRVKWTLEACKADSLQYNKRTEWRDANGSAYQAALENDWIEECCAHMTVMFKWTLEACKTDALPYETKRDWRHQNASAYQTALKNGWLKECCAHMTVLFKWALESCKADALEYETKTEWIKACRGAYGAALKNGWIEECCGHMDIHKQITSKDSDAISVRPQTKAA